MTIATGNLDPVLGWLRAYAGSNDFVQSVKRADAKWGLSDRQYDAVARFMAREDAPASQTALIALDGLDLTTLPTGTGRYAVPNSDGGLTFFRIDHIKDADSRWNGWVFVKQVIGGHPDEKRGSQRPGASYRGTHVELLRAVVANPVEAMQTFGRELGFCGHCGKTLTDATSRELGIGPVCAGMVGL